MTSRAPLPAGDAEALVSKVAERYGEIARSGAGCCGAPAEAGRVAVALGYERAELDALPEEANLGLGCGAPIPWLALEPGETVLDLGSGPGLDAFLAARAVGAGGHVIGVDMAPEMLERARAAADRLGLDQVELRAGRLEALPVEAASVDAVTSNCVFNLVPDKPAVFREVARVLRPGGRLVVSDLVLSRPLPDAISRDLLAWVGCLAGAMLREDYFAALTAAGLEEPQVLHESDYVATLAATDPGALAAITAPAGLAPESLFGTVLSVTYRARRPLA